MTLTNNVLGLHFILCPNCENQCSVEHQRRSFRRCNSCDRLICRCCITEHRGIEAEFEEELA